MNRGRSGRSRPVPRFSRITRSLDVVAPIDCQASLILKQVAHDKYLHFAPWLLVGRYDQDALSVPYTFTGETTIRCDLPCGTVISMAALQPFLAKFLKSGGTLSDPPPTITGK
jgi:hypothetical protein